MDVNLIFRIAAVGILVSVVCQVLKHSGRDEQAFLTSLAGLVLVLFWMIPYVVYLLICSNCYFWEAARKNVNDGILVINLIFLNLFFLIERIMCLPVLSICFFHLFITSALNMSRKHLLIQKKRHKGASLK